MAPYSFIKGDIDKIPELRKEYISMTGAGLYVIAKVGHMAREQNLDLETIANTLCKLDWRREVAPGQPNPLFLGGILDASGNISNTRNTLNANTKKIVETLNETVEEI